ncbi:MAG: cisplatin damage response ATP-dependent DNA ligase, partial [Sphingomonadales bacterium]
MRAFADLLDALIYTRSRNAKLRLIGEYLKSTPDPDRGWAMAALTGSLDLPAIKPALVRALIEERVDPVLYRMSRDFVGDSAETIALLWPEPITPPDTSEPLTLAQVIDILGSISKSDAPAMLASMLDRLEADERFALLKLAMGALRAGVSARLAKTGLAQAFDLDVEAVEEVWHGLAPPYPTLFGWAEGTHTQPTAQNVPVFRPFMLAHPLEETQVSLQDYAAEWKWDGIRVQLVHVAGQTRLYSRAGDDITHSFPEVAASFQAAGVLDGELLVKGDAQGGEAGSFNALQQRLGRKVVSAKMLSEYPAFVRLYDILFDGADDLRALGWTERRARLETFAVQLDAERFDVSAVIDAKDFAELEE